MKRKIFDVIKQKLCRHRYEFVECDKIENGHGYFPSWYFLYRCEKCGKNKIVYIDNVLRDLRDVDQIQSIGYPKETIYLPNTLDDKLSAHRRESREAGYLVAKYYNKYGILLTAWGNREFGPKIDRNNLEMKSHDEMVKDKDRFDTLTLEESQFIMCRQEFKQSMERF